MFSLSDGQSDGDYLRVGVGEITGTYADESFWFELVRGGAFVLAMHVRRGTSFYQDSRWHDVVVSTGSGDNAVYIDGVRQPVTYRAGNGTTNEFTNIDNPDSMRIGCWNYNATGEASFFPGDVSHLAIYDRALTANEAIQWHENPKGLLMPRRRVTYFVAAGSLFTETPADSFTITESPVLDIAKVKTDSLTITEATAKLAQLVKADSLAITEATALSIAKEVNDALTITEATALSIAKEVDDALTISESAVMAIQIAVSDSVTITEATAFEIQKSISDNIDISESTAKVIQKAISDNVIISDVALSILQILAADGIIITDSVMSYVATIVPPDLKTRKEPIDREAETIEWHEIIDIERGVE